MEKDSKKTKKPLKGCIINFLIALALAIVFLLITFRFAVDSKSGITNEIMKVGNANQKITIYGFGILTAITIFITFIIRKFRLVAIFLLIFWIMGAGFFLLIDSINPQMYVCTKNTPSTTKPEFQRALSLILQRHEQYIKNSSNINNLSNLNNLTSDEINKLDSTTRYNFNFYTTVNSYQNCIKIDYGSLNTETAGSFIFNPNNKKQELLIVVSPKYQSTDDLLTAALLSHELQHAVDFINEYPEWNKTKESCYNTEARAFGRETWFFGMLNEEEKKSLIARSKLYDSQEVSNMLFVTDLIKESSEETTKALNDFVRQDTNYRNQCESLN